MSDVTEVLRHLPPAAVLAVAVALILGETGFLAGLLFPAEITLLFVGFLAYQGEFPLVVALLLMVAAAMAGDALAVRAGRRHGARVRASRLGSRVAPQQWQRAERFLHRFGGASALVARWVPFVRTLLPRLVGGAGLPYRRFLPWNAVGVLTAAGSSVLLGYLSGASYQRVAEVLGQVGLVLLGAVVLGAVVVAVRLRYGAGWRRRHPRAEV